MVQGRHQLERLFRQDGPILGPLMGYEVLSAFFLGAGLLNRMVILMRQEV